MKTSKSIAFILVFLLVGLSACKKENTKSTATSVTGNWNLQLWDGAPASGTLVFTTSTLNFNCSTYGFTEQDTYVQSGNSFTFTKTGGSSSVISGGNNWTMDTLTANVLRMTSHFGLLVRATK
ncbi:MAG TPA: hypothetical protein PLZ64_00470 [Chitinophagales bacterium]|nr:hypothetical protein [Chitinophagales bacterium]